MTALLTLSELTARSGIDVLDHLDTQVRIPVVDGLQAQGDLIVIPRDAVPTVRTTEFSLQVTVGRSGIDLLRNEAGGNPHSLVTESGRCLWYSPVVDHTGLALGLLQTSVRAYLIHPEHGATGIAPGAYVIRRQREQDNRFGSRSSTYFVAD